MVSNQSTYTVSRNQRSKAEISNAVVASGLCLAEARTLQEKLQNAEATAKPNETSWTRDVFWLELTFRREQC